MEVSSVMEQMLFATVRLEALDSSNNTRIGTSFFVNVQLEGLNYPFLVTNKHVVNGAEKGKLTFTKKEGDKPVIGTGVQLVINDFSKGWYGHPDVEIDVAIAPAVPVLAYVKSQLGVDAYVRMVGSDLFPSDDALKALDALEEVVFIGYPSGIWDRTNLLPVIRKGTTASPIALDYEGKKQFLIDASVFPGSSGSPVFLYNAGMYSMKTGATVIGSRLLFLGIVSAVLYREDLNEIKSISSATPVAISKQMIDLGLVFKTSAIMETVRGFLKDKGSKSK